METSRAPLERRRLQHWRITKNISESIIEHRILGAIDHINDRFQTTNALRPAISATYVRAIHLHLGPAIVADPDFQEFNLRVVITVSDGHRTADDVRDDLLLSSAQAPAQTIEDGGPIKA